SPRVQDAIVARVARRIIGRNTSSLLAPDALRVLLCGTSSPIPSPRRAEACTAIFAGRHMWIVDTGPGSWRTLALRRVRGEAIGAVFYTHLHSDHVGELGEFNLQTWVAGRPGPLRVYGPDGVTDLVHGFAQAYAADTRFRVAHHGAAPTSSCTRHRTTTSSTSWSRPRAKAGKRASRRSSATSRPTTRRPPTPRARPSRLASDSSCSRTSPRRRTTRSWRESSGAT